MNVKFFPYERVASHYPEAVNAMQTAIKAGNFILGPELEEFEHNFAQFLGVKHVVGVASGSDALLLSLKAAGVRPGDEVIVPAHTFKATVGVVHAIGATPILVDIKPEDGLIDTAQVHEAVTQKTKAIIPVHLQGNVRWLDAFPMGIPIVEDACQAIGASWEGHKAGTYGIAGAFSFYPAKILGCFGDGGCVSTNDDAVAEEIREMRNHHKGTNKEFGGNHRLDTVQAAVLNAKLPRLQSDLERRANIARQYDEAFSGTPLQCPPQRPGRVYQEYTIRTKRRDELHDWLAKCGIGTIKNEYPFTVETVKPPATVSYERETLRIPMHPYLLDGEVQYIIQSVDSSDTRGSEKM